AVADELLQMGTAPLVIPANPLIPNRHPPSRTGKLHAAHDQRIWAGDTNKIPQAGTKGYLVAKVVVALHHPPPQIPPGSVTNLLQSHATELFDTASQND
ncbi:hypothetical protein OMAG_000596, partial [Candidatus Omnitrophus magneticus]